MNFWKNNTIPPTPYYAVIFVSRRSDHLDGYPEMDEKTTELAMQQEGFLGYENIKSGNEGIFISYWASMESIDAWRKHPVHLEAKEKGKSMWYDRYLSQICLVQSSHEMKK